MICQQCKKTFQSKQPAKYCSSSCRLKAFRNKGVSTKKVINNETTNGTLKLTKTDRSFNEAYPDYYKFNNKLYTRKCFICDKPFKTQLSLIKVCSYKHYQELLSHLTTSYA